MAFNLNRLKAERIARGLTQEALASKLGISRESYAKKENGFAKISVEDFANILKALNLDADQASIFFEHSVRKKEQ